MRNKRDTRVKKVPRISTLFTMLSIVGIFIVIFCTGCSTSSYSNSKASQQISYKGNNGLVFSFMNANDLNTIYAGDGQEAGEILVEITNKGTFKIRQLETAYGGYDNTVIDVTPLEVDETDLDPITQYNPKGGYSLGLSKIMALSLGDAESYDIPLTLQYCYPYETQASIQICVDPTPNKKYSDDGCNPGNIQTDGQGAPVSVKSVTVEPMQEFVRVRIEIETNNRDLIYATSQALNCEEQMPMYIKQGVVLEEPPVLGVSNVGECMPTGTILFDNNNAVITCTFTKDRSIQYAYPSILVVPLKYYVRGSIQKNIKIINQKEQYNN